MLIKAFCEATGLPRDTVRFYVRRGLLSPAIGSGAGNRYQVFDAVQVERAKVIKAAQRLGFSLKEIAAMGTRYAGAGFGSEQKAAVLRAQIARLVEQERELRKVRAYLEAKLRWVARGERGDPPSLDAAPPRATVRPGSTNKSQGPQPRATRKAAPAGGAAGKRAR